MSNVQTQTGNGEIAVLSTSQGTDPHRPSPYTITEEILEERLKHENKGRFITQLCAAIAASLAALSFGTLLGWSSPSTKLLIEEVEEYNLTERNFGWVVSIMPLGCSAGIIPWSYAISKLGPKHTLMIQSPLYILGCIVLLTVRVRFKAYLAGRFLSGFLSIANIIGGERLLMDTVHQKNLPWMTVFFRSAIWLGVLLSYIIGCLWPKYFLTLTCAGIPIINSILLLFLPESPVFLYDKSELKAEKALSWYRGQTNISTEMRSIRKDAELRKMATEMYKYMFYSKVVVKGLLIVLGLNLFQVLSGYYIFIFFNFYMLNKLKYGCEETIVLGIIFYISNLTATVVHYYIPFGVRKPLLVSTSLTAISLTILSIYLFFYEVHHVHLEKTVPPILFISIFVISYEIGLSTYPDVLIYEYLPYQVHVVSKIISRIWFWGQVFLVTKYFIIIRYVTNNSITFALMALFAYIGILFCYFFVIETKGKNLIQIQIEIGGNPIGNRGAYRPYRIDTGTAVIT